MNSITKKLKDYLINFVNNLTGGNLHDTLMDLVQSIKEMLNLHQIEEEITRKLDQLSDKMTEFVKGEKDKSEGLIKQIVTPVIDQAKVRELLILAQIRSIPGSA